MPHPICPKCNTAKKFEVPREGVEREFICLKCDVPAVDPRIKGWLSSTDLKPPE